MDLEFVRMLDFLLLCTIPIKCSSKTTTTITTTIATAKLIARNNLTTTTTTPTSLTPFESTKKITSSSSLVMGSCFGSLLKKDASTSSSCSSMATCSLWRQATDEQEDELMPDEERNGRHEKLIYRIIKFKRKQKRKQFVDKFWEHRNSTYSQLSTKNGNESTSDIQLQNLDVHTLLNSTGLAKESVINAAAPPAPPPFCSRTSSSLDLEWEHEYFSHMRPYAAPLPTSTSAAAASASTTAPHIDAVDLTDSWQFLSHRHFFDEDPLNSISSQPSLSGAAAAASAEATASMDLSAAEQEQARRQQPSARVNSRTQQQDQQQKHQQQQQQQQTNGIRHIGNALTRTSSRTSCSHISTPESLEWDIDEDQQRQLRVEDDNLGLETLELLHQIEQLKNKVLNETGDGLYVDGGSGGGAGEYREEINIS